MQRAIYVRSGPLAGTVVTLHGDLEPGPEIQLIKDEGSHARTLRLDRVSGWGTTLDNGLVIQVFDSVGAAVDAEADYRDPEVPHSEV